VDVKHLPKHLQPRWRYIAVDLEGWPDSSLAREDFQRAVWYSAQNLHGDTGSAVLDLSVIQFRFDDGQGEAMLRVRRGGVTDARAVLACIDVVEGDSVGVRIRGTSGTVQACEEKYMGNAPIDPEESHVVFDGANRPAIVRDQRIDIEADTAFVGATNLDTE
jgi:ribonuclease P/MRP protein subunit POP5